MQARGLIWGLTLIDIGLYFCRMGGQKVMIRAESAVRSLIASHLIALEIQWTESPMARSPGHVASFIGSQRSKCELNVMSGRLTCRSAVADLNF